MTVATPEQITAFITRWSSSGAAERANYQMFLSELCDIIGVPRPDPTAADTTRNLYVFDRAITRTHPDGSTSTNYIDLYKARHFVNETMQGLSADTAPDELTAKPAATKSGHGKRGTAAFDKALERAYHQARGYITAHGPDAETLSACFGRKSQKRSDQITAILATLRALGHLP